MSALIRPEELKKRLGQPHVRILDASYNLPPSTMGIAGALDFNIDDIADPEAPFAHTIPSGTVFSEKVGALGIENRDLVIVYDRNGIAMAAARAWWMFRLFGHENVKILDGGLPAWVRAGYAIEEKDAAPNPVFFRARLRSELVKYLGQVEENLSKKTFTVLDARAAQRFSGEGHIPGSLNVPFMSLLNTDGTLKQKDDLERVFQSAHANFKGNFACSCGSGVTACVVALALYELGYPNAAVYDGSWTEWGSNPALPKEKGA